MLRKNLSSLVLAIAIALVTGALPLAMQLQETSDVAVRTVPWRTQAGQITKSSPIGQGFRPEWNGLDRVDLALVALGATDGAQLELVLRQGSADGEVLRRARMPAGALDSGRGWVAFEFDPIEHSAGQAFWFSLEIPGEKQRSPYSPWIRFNGHPGEDSPWGDRIISGKEVEGLIADHSAAGVEQPLYGTLPAPNLTAIAFATDSIQPSPGEIRLEVWPADEDRATSKLKRSVTIGPEEQVFGGYTYFAFEPVPESRGKPWSFSLSLNQSARLVGFESGPSLKTFHSGPIAPGPLLGLTRGP
ncbi:MAG: hypothetical protein ACI8X5_003725, partial [Planctomycetota bacterium]